jgi:hypothetical protein
MLPFRARILLFYRLAWGSKSRNSSGGSTPTSLPRLALAARAGRRATCAERRRRRGTARVRKSAGRRQLARYARSALPAIACEGRRAEIADAWAEERRHPTLRVIQFCAVSMLRGQLLPDRYRVAASLLVQAYPQSGTEEAILDWQILLSNQENPELKLY